MKRTQFTLTTILLVVAFSQTTLLGLDLSNFDTMAPLADNGSTPSNPVDIAPLTGPKASTILAESDAATVSIDGFPYARLTIDTPTRLNGNGVDLGGTFAGNAKPAPTSSFFFDATAVPEPAAWALIPFFGLLVMLSLRRHGDRCDS